MISKKQINNKSWQINVKHIYFVGRIILTMKITMLIRYNVRINI